MLSKNVKKQKHGPKLVFFNEKKKYAEDLDDFWHDAKGKDDPQPIWLSECPIKGHFRAKNAWKTQLANFFLSWINP